MLYTTIVTILATVDILKALGKDKGEECMPKIEFEGNGVRLVILVRHPFFFPCRFIMHAYPNETTK